MSNDTLLQRSGHTDNDDENKPWWQYRVVYQLLFLGFSSGLPLALIFSTLSLWLSEAGVTKSAVTYFSWAALGYSFKFIWSPLVDKLPLPLLTKWLGRRRGWLLLSQIAIMAAILLMAFTNPQNSLSSMAVAAVLLGFAAATQDIVNDAFRIESASVRLQAMLTSTYIAGYRIGMIVSGAGALILAQWFGSTKMDYSYLAWRNTYVCMALLMLLGVATTFLVREPNAASNEQGSKDNGALSSQYKYPVEDYVRFFILFGLSIGVFILVYMNTPDSPQWFGQYFQPIFAFFYGSGHLLLAVMAAYLLARSSLLFGWVNEQLFDEGYRQPFVDFFQRYGRLAVWILLLIGFYRVSDIVMGIIANVFYQDLGYSKSQIGSVSKLFGVVMTIVGSFAGGFLTLRLGVIRVLLIGAVLSAGTNLLFMVLTGLEPDVRYLIGVISADNLSAGIAISSFVAWLSSLTKLSFTATQYAIFSSVMTLFPKLLGGYSGSIVESVGYNSFFLMTACLGIPVIILILYLDKRLKSDD